MPILAASSGSECASPGRRMHDRGVGLRLTDVLSRRRLRDRAVLALLGGAAVGLGQAPFGLVPVALAGLFGGLLLLLVARTPREAFFTGWAFGTGHFAVALFWIVEPFLIDLARHGWMAPFALVFLAGGLALFWGAAFAGARMIGGGAARCAAAWAAALSVAEMARGYLLTGFPWALVGHVWIDTGALPWAAVFGPYGLTAATLGLVAVVVALLVPHSARWWIVAPLPFAAFVLPGHIFDGPAPVAPDAPVVRLVQPNAPQDEKWDPDRVFEFYARQLDFTAEAADPAPDFFVWPESAIPWPLDAAGPALSEIAAAASGAPVVVGLNRRAGQLWFNALAVVEADGLVSDVYDKHRLVPFGEYIPFGGLTRHLGLQSFAARDGFGFSPGPGTRLVDLGAAGIALPLICYEAIFARHVRAAPERPDFLLQITNDAWFGEISGPYQHLAQARLRAAEQGLPMVRVANTGVSAVIDAAGRVTAQIPLGEAGWKDARLPPPGRPTLYARTGDWPVLLVLAVVLAALSGVRRVSD
jgi:apolipoprotein N-acyltransferase